MSSRYGSDVDGAYSESSPFVRLFGTPSRTKILDVFLRKHYEELTASDVIELAGISRNSFHRNIDDLEDLGVIEQTGTVGNSNVYQLNKDSDLAKTLASSHADIVQHTTSVLDTTVDPVESAIDSTFKDSDDDNNPQEPITDEFSEKIDEAIVG